MGKKRTQVRTYSSTHAGTYANCPNGHQRVHILNGQDALGKYQEIWCNEPGCAAPKLRLRKETVGS